MDAKKRFLYTVTGFVGGVAFLISCGGGGGSGSGSISSADAAVPTEQMWCQGVQDLVDLNGIPDPVGLRCYDTNNRSIVFSLENAYAEGWRLEYSIVIGSAFRHVFVK